jgi:hypothetical protein
MASYIPALVIRFNNEDFINPDLSVGAIKEVPTPDGGASLESDVWIVPVNLGFPSGFTYTPYNVNNSAENVAPLFAVAGCKLSSNKSADDYILLGTTAQYVTAVGGGTAMPTAWPTLSHTRPLIPACQTIGGLNASVPPLYNAVFGLPSLVAGYTYFPFGFLNGVALTSAAAGGYSTISALLTFLNASWSSVGTWTATGDNLTLIVTQSAGTGLDVFCGGFLAVNPSI